jgi:two-component system nitrogen regulation response regulator GlnG
LVQAGRFRADLLHRLDVVRLQLPPLRERRGDVSRLAENFLAQACAKLGMPAKRVAPSAREALRAHDWPGNVRELENVCWRLAALAPSDTITVGDVEQALPHGARSSTRDAADWDALLGQWARARLAEGADGLHAEARTRLDRALLEAALQFTNGRRADAAARLGVGRNTITRKLGSGRRRS